MLLAACAAAQPGDGRMTPVATTAPAPTMAATPTVVATLPSPSPTPVPTAAATASPNVAAASPTITLGSPNPAGGGGMLPYLDDRSGPEQLLRSYVSALDRKEYLRAYSYWQPEAAAAQLPPFEELARGYADTASVRLVLGQIGGDAGAGQLYYAAPVELVARGTDGGQRGFVGCYRLHLSRPELQAAPPFRPLAIEGAAVQSLPTGADAAVLLARACPEASQRPPAIGQTPSDPAAIGPDRYLDDRSTPEQVLRSYYNAVNRKEYARAYSYIEPSATGSFPQFAELARGYADTASVQLRIGAVVTGAAAGNLYFTAPVALLARSADGAAHAFAGCYTLHLGQPSVQATPPFQPMGIRAATIQPVAGQAEAEELIKRPCPAPS